MTTTTPPNPPPHTQRLPWPFIAAALVAMAVLFISGKRFAGVPVMGLLLVGSQAMPGVRLRGGRVLGWVVRLGAWSVLIAFGPERHAEGNSILLEPDYIHMFGFLCCGELVLRAWTRSARGPSRGEFLLLGALILTAASNTYERAHVEWLAPLYTLFLLLALRSFPREQRPVVSSTGTTMPTTSRTRSLLLLRGGTIVLVLAVGFGIVVARNRYEQTLTQWAVDTLRSHRGAGRGAIGLAGTPRLQSMFNPDASTRRVLLIEGSRNERHLRALSFDSYESRTWRPLPNERGFDRINPDRLATIGASGVALRVIRLAGDGSGNLLPAPLNTAVVRAEAPLERDGGGAVREAQSGSGSRVARGVDYELVVPTDERFQGPLAIAPDDTMRARLLQISPEIDPRVVELGRSVARARSSPSSDSAALRVARIVQHLRANHSYSLRHDAPADGDPLSDFILNARSAHCEYFASALVIMARSAGVPARLVTGYYAHERWDDDSLVVRDRDAHAWAECWIDGIGWTTVDATPSGGRPDQLFDPPSRLRRIWERIADAPRMLREWFAGLDRASLALLISAPAALAAAVAGLRALPGWLRARRARRALASAARPGRPTDEQLAELAMRFERVLTRHRAACPPSRTWREHLRGRPVGLPDAPLDHEICGRFVDAYEAERFGSSAHGNDPPHDRRALLGILETLERGSGR